MWGQPTKYFSWNVSLLDLTQLIIYLRNNFCAFRDQKDLYSKTLQFRLLGIICTSAICGVNIAAFVCEGRWRSQPAHWPRTSEVPGGKVEEELWFHLQRCLQKHSGIHATTLTGLWEIRHVGFRNNHLSRAFRSSGLKSINELNFK